MTSAIGSLSIGLALLAAAVAGLLAVASGRFASASLLRAARWSFAAYFGLLTAAGAMLLVALLGSDFSLQYVADYSERALPVGYKLAAFWAGQSGSLLLWAWMLGAAAVIYAFRNRREEPGTESAVTYVTLAAVLGFFAMLMLYAGADGNPFAPGETVPADGKGLNPMLQDPAMIAHPPMLFLGYAGFTVPFAILFGALVAGRRDNQWVVRLRRWTMASWLFLSIGILLGAQWAYYELGWGGYWAWDPVENASLLPWLTATALMHSIMVQQHRGMLKMWNAALVAVTFLLCIFGTYLTRSGVVSSVHAFGGSAVGTMFLGFLVIATAVAVGLIVWRRRLLRTENVLETLLGREGMFLAANVLLVAMTVITLVGTIFPIFGGFFSTGTPGAEGPGAPSITVTPDFYNKVVAPLGMLLVGLMAMGPLLVYGRDAGRRLMRKMIVPALLAVAAVVVAVVKGIREPWAVACVLVATVTLVNVLVDFARSLFSAVGSGNGLVVSAARLFDASHRRWGAQIVHTGVILVVVGMVASSLFSQKHLHELKPGQQIDIGGRTLAYDSLKEVRQGNYTAVEATVRFTEPNGAERTVKPQRRFYDKSERPSAEVAIDSNWRRDIYVTLAGWENGGSVAAIELIVNPLVSWIWVGGAVMTLGAVLGLIPRFRQATAVATVWEPEPQAAKSAPAPRKGSRGVRGQRPVPVASAS